MTVNYQITEKEIKLLYDSLSFMVTHLNLENGKYVILKNKLTKHGVTFS